jgi:hypothetical protein
MSGKTFFLVSIFLAVGLSGGVSNGDLIAYYNFGTTTATTANQGTAGTVADGVLVNMAQIIDIDTSARGLEYAYVQGLRDGVSFRLRNATG